MKIQIRRDLLNYNLSLKYIVNKNRVSTFVVEKELLDIITTITKWISKCIEKNISEFIESAGTISRWKEYILNSFIDERYSNGYTEGINKK